MKKIEGQWITNPHTQAIFDTYALNDAKLYFVGGCVRNALLCEAVADIDMCSSAVPDVARDFLEKAGFHVIPTGIEHGTLTVMSGGIPHEITTFRKDVATDGRRAVVAFSDTIKEDALRRDFTVNALYADRTGLVLDPLGALPDIAARRIRFIEDPKARIQEDYLRILRFFRFQARIAADAPDPDALDAISRNLDGLALLSAERITMEVLKILALPDPSATIGFMQATGVLHAILPGAEMRALAPMIHYEQSFDLSPDPIGRLTALGDEAVIRPLRLSKADSKRAAMLRTVAAGSAPAHELGYRYGAQTALRALALRAAFFETPPAPDCLAEVALGTGQTFPLSARDLPQTIKGSQIGKNLRRLEGEWIASRFTKTKFQLLG